MMLGTVSEVAAQAGDAGAEKLSIGAIGLLASIIIGVLMRLQGLVRELKGKIDGVANNVGKLLDLALNKK